MGLEGGGLVGLGLEESGLAELRLQSRRGMVGRWLGRGRGREGGSGRDDELVVRRGIEDGR